MFVLLSAECFPISSCFNATVIVYYERIIVFLIDEIYCCFFIQLRESLYDPPQFGFIL